MTLAVLLVLAVGMAWLALVLGGLRAQFRQVQRQSVVRVWGLAMLVSVFLGPAIGGLWWLAIIWLWSDAFNGDDRRRLLPALVKLGAVTGSVVGLTWGLVASWTQAQRAGIRNEKRMADDSREPFEFMFVTCQVGAEPAVKADVREWPESRFAFSRPGFLTFKVPAALASSETPPLRSVFARAVGWSLGKVEGADPEVLAAAVWQLAAEQLPQVAFNRLHVWPRDLATPGHRGFEPGLSPEAVAARDELVRQTPRADVCSAGLTTEQALTAPTGRGDRVLDCILVEPTVWWVGHHRAWTRSQCWPGGFWPGTPPVDMISRAYLKMCEALDWSQLPVRAGQRAAEIGCAPGGASKALLDRGLHVLGIDPAEVAPALSAHPNFVHLKKRGSEVRRRYFRGIQWLFADMNVSPQAALGTLEAILTHAEVHVQGLITNIKLPEWNLSEEVPSYLNRIRGWGFEHATARQLGHNRQEICVAAWR